MPLALCLPVPRALALSLATCLMAGALPSQAAETLREGAYADEIDGDRPSCVTRQALERLTARSWKPAMQQRGQECTMGETTQPMPGLETWKATCTPAGAKAGTGAAGTAGAGRSYDITVHGRDDRLVIDSRVTVTATGDLQGKQAFLGNYRGACTADTPALNEWRYLDPAQSSQPSKAAASPAAPSPSSAPAAVRKAVAQDLIRCGNVMNALSITVPQAKQAGMRAGAEALMAAAVSVYDAEPAFYTQALEASAKDVAAQVVGTSAETRFALYQSCSGYLQPDGIEQAIRQRSAEGQK